MSQAWLEQRERGSIRLLAFAALLLGRRLARLVRYPVCLYFVVAAPQPQAASRKYLSRVLGRAPRFSDLCRHFLAFGAVALDWLYLLKDRFELFEWEIFGEDMLREENRAARGCLLLGAHVGSFEILRALGSSRRCA